MAFAESSVMELVSAFVLSVWAALLDQRGLHVEDAEVPARPDLLA